MAQASVDIGSNSLVFIVVDDAGNTLFEESAIVGLGKGLGDHGRFADGPMSASMRAFTSFAQSANAYGVPPGAIKAIATSAARRASNASDFFGMVQQETGIVVQVIGGLEEARLTWIGSLHKLQMPEQRVAVVDLGGGSTEIVLGKSSTSTNLTRQSIEMGTVRLMEQFGIADSNRYPPEAIETMRRYIDTLLHDVNWDDPPAAVVAVAGTATTIGAMQLGLRTWERDAVHGSIVRRSDLVSWHNRLAGSTHVERLEWAAVSPQRADLLLAGTAVLCAVCQRAGVDHLVISDGGIRHGILL